MIFYVQFITSDSGYNNILVDARDKREVREIASAYMFTFNYDFREQIKAGIEKALVKIDSIYYLPECPYVYYKEAVELLYNTAQKNCLEEENMKLGKFNNLFLKEIYLCKDENFFKRIVNKCIKKEVKNYVSKKTRELL